MRMNYLTGLAAVATLACAMPATAQQIQVTVNGSPVHFYDTQPRMIDGRVLVPLRGVLEKLGAHVGWDQQTQTVTADRGRLDIVLPIGSHTAQVDNRPVNLDVPAMVVNGSTLVPLRFVSESLGADVGWSNETQTVAIRMPDGGEPDVHFRAHREDSGHVMEPAHPHPMPPGPRFDHHAIDVGAVIPVRLSAGLNSDHNSIGDDFSAAVVNTRFNTGLPDGTRIEGEVRDVVPAHGDRPGMLDLQFKRIVFPNGNQIPIDGSAINLDNRSIHRTQDGRLIASRGKNEEQMKWVGIGAGAGLVLGAATHGNAFLDTLLGGGAGYALGQAQRRAVHNVNLPAGTELGVRIDQRP